MKRERADMEMRQTGVAGMPKATGRGRLRLDSSLLFVFLGCLLLWACQTRPKTPVSPTAEWLEETGAAAVRDDVSPTALARHQAVQAAEADARLRILARLATTEVKPGRTVTQEMARDPYVWSRIMGLLDETRSHEQTWLDDGRVETWLKVDLDFIRRICLEGREAQPLGPAAR